MGRYSQAVEQNSQTWGKVKIDTEMRILLVLSLFSLSSCAPQYGGGNSQPVRAPAQSSPQVSCRTEYAEVWDTEYVETETQDCQTVQVKQCNTAYKQVCSQKYRDETEYYTETECKTDYKQDCEY